MWKNVKLIDIKNDVSNFVTISSVSVRSTTISYSQDGRK